MGNRKIWNSKSNLQAHSRSQLFRPYYTTHDFLLVFHSSLQDFPSVFWHCSVILVSNIILVLVLVLILYDNWVIYLVITFRNWDIIMTQHSRLVNIVNNHYNAMQNVASATVQQRSRSGLQMHLEMHCVFTGDNLTTRSIRCISCAMTFIRQCIIDKIFPNWAFSFGQQLTLTLLKTSNLILI